jgi:hypothetical protein
MNERRFSYEQNEIRMQVDDIYSSHEVREEMRALRSIIRERVQIPRTRVIRVHTIMNPLVSELFGKRSWDYVLNEDETLNNDAAAEDQITIVQDS